MWSVIYGNTCCLPLRTYVVYETKRNACLGDGGGPPLARLAQQAEPGRQQVAGGRGPAVAFGRERRQTDDRGTAVTASRCGDGGGGGDGGDGDGDRPGRRRRLAGTLRLSGVQQFVSVRVVAAVQPRDRGHREQDERRERQVDDGYPEQRRVRAVKNKTHTRSRNVSAAVGTSRARTGASGGRESKTTRTVRLGRSSN